MTDSRGTTKTFKRACVAIDRDPRLEGSPVLLSKTTLDDLDISLRPKTSSWWFENKDFELLQPHQFAKAAKNEAMIFAVLKLPEEIWLPDEEELKSFNSDDVPPELEAFRDVFDHDKAGLLPRVKNSDHAIEIENNGTVPHGPIYPLSQNELQVLHAYIIDNLEKGRIRPSKSPAGAPVLFVPKKDGGLRLCVDYRGLNRVSVKNRYPLPLISEILDRVTGSKYFSKIDIKDAYYRIRLREGDEWKTAFRTRYGHFEYMVMPFGLCNAPATFQSYINNALGELVDTICVAYLDDILVFTKTRDSHTKALRNIFERLRRSELYVKPSKCQFYRREVEFLGFILTPDGVKMDNTRVEAIQNWEEPTTFREVQVFLGFCNFYRRFIKRYSLITLPLTSMMKGSKNGKKPGPVQLSPEEKGAFQALKDAFSSADLLYHFDPTRQIRIETDASKFGMSGIMSQPNNDNIWHPVAFWSRKFTGPELNYATPDQELFAIVHSFKHWRQYLDGCRYPVEVLSDHANLRTFMSQTKLTGRQARWCMYLMPFEFVIKHRSGKTNPADGLSRIPNSEEVDPGLKLMDTIQERFSTESLEDLVQIEEATVLNLDHLDADEINVAMDTEDQRAQSNSIEMTKWENESPGIQFWHESTDRSHKGVSTDIDGQRAQPNSAEITKWENLCENPGIQQKPLNATEAGVQAIRSKTDKDLVEQITRLQRDDPEVRRQKGGEKGPNKGWTIQTSGLLTYRGRMYVPHKEGLRTKLLQMHHDDPTAGHFGRSRTEELLKRHYHWIGMLDDVKKYVKTCEVCQAMKTPRHRPYGELQPLPLPKRPFAEVSMDFITGLPPSIWNRRVVDAILVIVDRFSKWCIFTPVSTTMDAAELATLFHDIIELSYGPPDGIVSDRGTVFTSRFFTRLCYLTKVRNRFSTAFHPQTDGQTERMNQIIETYLRCFIGTENERWPALLKTAQFACNNSQNSTIGASPFQVLLGYNPNFQIREQDAHTEKEAPNAAERIQKLHILREGLQKRWRSAIDSQKSHYDKKHTPKTFKRGEFVGLSTKNLRLKDRKLAPKFIGPFRILECVGKQAYRLALPEQYALLHNVFPVQFLERWNSRIGAESTMPIPELEDEEEWEVEEIKDHHNFDGELHYLLKWQGWPAEYNQWVPKNQMNAPKLINSCENKLRRK